MLNDVNKKDRNEVNIDGKHMRGIVGRRIVVIDGWKYETMKVCRVAKKIIDIDYRDIIIDNR